MTKKSSLNTYGDYLTKISLFLLIILFPMTVFFFSNTLNRVNAFENERITTIARMAAALIDGTKLASLRGDESDLTRPEYVYLKSDLTRLHQSDTLISSAFLMRRTEGGKYILLVDSESPDSAHYSPPGKEFARVTDGMAGSFVDGTSLVSGPMTDSENTWRTALSPVLDRETGNVVAVLGIEYSEDVWNILPLKRPSYTLTGFSILGGLIILAVLFGIQNIRIRSLNRTSQEERQRLRIFLDQLPGMAFRCLPDGQGTMTYVSPGCKALTGYSPEMLIDNRGVSFGEIIVPEYREALHDLFRRTADTEKDVHAEFEIVTRDGKRKWVLVYGEIINGDNNTAEAIEGVILDISEKKRAEAENEYLNNHDALTGLYNRRYFFETLLNLESGGLYPISCIVGNINGFSLINNAFGYEAGDKLLAEVGKILGSYMEEGSVIAAHMGGDEFALILPSADEEKVQKTMDSLSRDFQQCRDLNMPAINCLSMDFGQGTATSRDSGVFQAFNNAQKMMRQAKLLNKASASHGILNAMLATLYEKSGETEEHSARLACTSTKIGESLGLAEEELNKLKLFSMLHDIGKMGIDDRILKKEGPLTEDEWKIMRTHPQIGYRIAMASSEFKEISPYIIAHHERWDGKGYPRGLKGEEIPLLARILTVADAYDAMTSKRVYKDAWKREAALGELKKNSGTQFDPKIIDIFLSLAEAEDFGCPDDAG